jgi:hypothetical protein
MIMTSALALMMQTANSAGQLPPIETYEFLTDTDDRCIRERTAECDQMSEPRLFRGLWRAAFESSTLTPPERIDCEDPKSDLPCIWLEGDELPSGSKYDCVAYELEFVGRRMLHLGMYGHLGGSPYKVVVDRLISAKRLTTACDENGNLISLSRQRE